MLKRLIFRTMRSRRSAKNWLVLVGLVILWAFVSLGDSIEIWINGPIDKHRADITCRYPKVIDGDSLHCSGKKIRLMGIDAPERPGNCKPGKTCAPGNYRLAKAYLKKLTRTRVYCKSSGTDKYQRVLARCSASNIDLSCAMLDAEHAIRRYGFILCP